MSFAALAVVFVIVLALNLWLTRFGLPRPVVLGVLLAATLLSSQVAMRIL
jgi:hypothetical protein